ncbi:NCEH1 [Branchiostoma lanceolatum]|uniref:NCEH1 protein n=1 Tax=Branchiostoma lanceolatum TaxID=7740 RepID=A0A8K0A1G6_BRALA|nr:NCEH1 [Branchiostoma lanceolatum]
MGAAMTALKVGGGLLAVVMTTVVYYYCHLVLAGFPEPGKVTIIVMVVKFQRLVGRIYELLGFGSSLDYRRKSGMGHRPRIGDPSLLVTDTSFDGVKVRLYQPQGQDQGGDRAGLVFMHGGGWILLSVDIYDNVTRHIAKATGAVVVSVDYRLAPEHTFPIPFKDCLNATKYFLHHPGEYGVDPARVGVAGDAAGGNLAAAVALKLAQESSNNVCPLKLQALIYPALQALDFQTASYRTRETPWLDAFTPASHFNLYLNGNDSWAEKFVSHSHISDQVKTSRFAAYVDRHLVYPSLPQMTPRDDAVIDLPEEIKDILNPYFCPLMAGDSQLAGCPNTCILVCEFDVLRDDGIMYAKRLGKVGVGVKLEHFEKGFHGILNLTTKPMEFQVGKEVMKSLVSLLNENL